MKKCKTCGEEKTLDDFVPNSRMRDGRLNYCRPCVSQAKRESYRADPRRAKNYNLRKFGITIEQYERMVDEQGGVCAICGGLCPTGRALAVDHCHETGIVRGLLCSKCNRAIGLLGDSVETLQKAINYLGRIT